MQTANLLRQHEPWLKEALLRHLQNLIRIDTRTDRRRETLAANYISEQLLTAGLRPAVVEPTPGKGSVIASLACSALSPAPALVLLSHLDTAGWDETGWQHHPLSGTFRDGCVWGRGAIDCKGLAAVWTVLACFIRRIDLESNREIIFAATADEEAGGTWGAKWLLDNTRLFAGAGVVLGEGGGFPLRFGGKDFITCQTGEKGLYAVHGRPEREIAGILKTESGRAVSPSAREFARRIFRRQNAAYRALAAYPPLWPRLLKRLQAAEPAQADIDELLRITVAGTAPDGSVRLRVPPAGAGDLERIFGQRPAVIEPAAETALNTRYFTLICLQASKHRPEAAVLPHVTPGYSDNRFFRQRGIPTYGFFPVDDGAAVAAIHRRDEKVALDSLYRAFCLLFAIVAAFTGPDGSNP